MNVVPGARPPWFPLPPLWRGHAISTAGAVLLETAGGLGPDHISYLFAAPEVVLRASSAAELLTLLDDIEATARDGFYIAGRIDYEAGYALHNISSNAPSQPLACFGVYRQALRFDHHTGTATGPALPDTGTHAPPNARPLLSAPHLQIDREAYAEKFAAVQRLLAAGDTYQVNFTSRVEADLLGSPLELYEALIEAQPVDYAAILHFDDTLTLSFSPELFFHIEPDSGGRRIVTRPMKGTAPRGSTPAADAAQREWLAHDEKNHAEHVMIVDLLRNDLGRICVPGSVRAEDLFRIEPYPTLFQMTSTISGALNSGAGFKDVIRALFPSGSVTGAPKRRTMEIIRDLEDAPRGVYTGAIGFLAPGGDACFSVPIRTLNLRDNAISMGVGGGVVADSIAAAEYDECLLKASFLSKAATAPRLIETILWNDGFPLLELHLSRLRNSAAQLGFECDTAKIHAALNTLQLQSAREIRVRLLLSIDGEIEITSGEITGPRSNLRVRIAARRILSTDPWRQHKITRRTLYDREFAQARAADFDEVLFLNERDELVEGAISNLFVEIAGQFCTPPLTAGALPGVYRQHLMDTRPNVVERTLRLEDLASASTIYLCNAVRGLRSVGSLHFD
jgi:para-aminobenzoate synthetase/4-amino-4-deoxychorismate lyase